jgi:hypothetical protein
MRVVQFAKDGAAELNWMWLPTFIGQNHLVLRELGNVWDDKFAGKLEHTEQSLDMLHEFTLDWFQEKFKIEGLRAYLAGISNVTED